MRDIVYWSLPIRRMLLRSVRGLIIPPRGAERICRLHLKLQGSSNERIPTHHIIILSSKPDIAPVAQIDGLPGLVQMKSTAGSHCGIHPLPQMTFLNGPAFGQRGAYRTGMMTHKKSHPSGWLLLASCSRYLLACDPSLLRARGLVDLGHFLLLPAFDKFSNCFFLLFSHLFQQGLTLPRRSHFCLGLF